MSSGVDNKTVTRAEKKAERLARKQAKKQAKRFDPEDDGRVIANMNVDGMPWHNPLPGPEAPADAEGNREKLSKLDKKQTFFLVMGVVGAAIATVLSRFVELAIILVWTHTHRERNPFVVGLYRSLRVPGELFRRILVLGAPLLLNEFLWSGGMTVLNQCYSLRGLEVVSAFNISNTVGNLFFCAFIATGNAISIIVGQLLGAGELERAVDEDRKLIAFSLALSVGIGLLMALVSPFIPQIYNTTDTVKALAVKLLLVYAAMMPLFSYTNSCYFTLRSGGKTLITFAFDSLFVWVFSIPVAFWLSRGTDMGIVLMYAIVELLNLVKCGIGTILVRRRRWVVNLVGKA